MNAKNLQCEMDGEPLGTVDSTWMLNEEDTWSYIQTSAKSLSALVLQLDERMNSLYDETCLNINGSVTCIILAQRKNQQLSMIFWKNRLKRMKSGSSHQRWFLRRGVFRNFAKFTAKNLCQSLFFDKVY